MSRLVLIKLGGGLITDKTKPLSPQPQVIKQLAKEIAQAKDKFSDTHFIIGNGAGSFGHYLVHKHGLGTCGALSGKEKQVREVHESVAKLNSLVAAALETEGLKTKSFSGEELFNKGVSLSGALQSDITPLVYGDIISGGQYQVVSTEEIFEHLLSQLSGEFSPIDIVLATSVEGVLNQEGKLIEEIDASHQGAWHEMQGFDVTGGMKQKLAMAQKMAETAQSVRIIGVNKPGNLLKAIEGKKVGTKVN